MSFPLTRGLSLEVSDQPAGDGTYPTRRLQKGLLLAEGGQGLAEEGVGFGVPVLKRGMQTVFPGDREISWERNGADSIVRAAFCMDLVERLAGHDGASVRSRPLYTVKDSLAALHRRFPALRGLLTAVSSGARRVFGWETAYIETASAGTVVVTYEILRAGSMHIAADLSALSTAGLTAVILMNEQGARSFDRYRDSNGTMLEGARIGAWHEVTAEEAAFVSSGHGVAFSLRQAPRARLYRGRELIGSRLAWSGFGYSLPATMERFEYDVRIERL